MRSSRPRVRRELDRADGVAVTRHLVHGRALVDGRVDDGAVVDPAHGVDVRPDVNGHSGAGDSRDIGRLVERVLVRPGFLARVPVDSRHTQFGVPRVDEFGAVTRQVARRAPFVGVSETPRSDGPPPPPPPQATRPVVAIATPITVRALQPIDRGYCSSRHVSDGSSRVVVSGHDMGEDARCRPIETHRLSHDGAVDADGHILEPSDLWERYIDPQYRDRALRVAQDENGLDELIIDGRRSLMSRHRVPVDACRDGTSDLAAMAKDPDITYDNHAPLPTTDTKERLAYLDRGEHRRRDHLHHHRSAVGGRTRRSGTLRRLLPCVQPLDRRLVQRG